MSSLGRCLLCLLCLLALLTPRLCEGQTLRENNEALLARLADVHGLSQAQVDSLRAIFRRSGVIGQGNPAISIHPVTREDCQRQSATLGIEGPDPLFLSICGAPYMAPLYDPQTQRPEDATVCIDQFEFPDIPCEYPVVWVRASEAASICEILGKRLCDAHEWEGACAGALLPPDYRFDLARGKTDAEAVRTMRQAHNLHFGTVKTWSYGSSYRTEICGTGGRKSSGCDGGSWSLCGSNTYPCGYFPDCKSGLEVYDLNGNAAEHMNLPLALDEMASDPDRSYGVTEMKGSWFVFDSYRAHEDWCRWRAPFWHGSRVRDPKSHRNYHLGFRCCDDVGVD